MHRLGGLWVPHLAQEATDSQPAACPPFLLFAGRHVPDKRVTAIPAALALERARTPGLQAIIVGDGLRGAVYAELSAGP